MEPTPPSHHEQPGPQEPAPSPGRRRFIVESAITLVTTAALAFGVQAAVAKPYLIPSESMLPTLEVGERVVVDRVSYRFASPEPGDIVVFRPPAGAEEPGLRDCVVPRQPDQACPLPWTQPAVGAPYIKRIVAGPGDRVSIEGGRAIVNGEPDEAPAIPCPGQAECELPREITIPEGHYFVLGDNRGASLDSRAWGPLPREWIIGKARLSYWPPRRARAL